jgi:hypothetical protein
LCRDGPATEAIAQALPSAEIWNILDDRLIDDAIVAGAVTVRLEQRLARLIDHAVADGADAILITCPCTPI